jgi:hypothetical protein
MELGRSWRTLLLMMLLLRPRGAGEVPGHRQQAALKDQRFRWRVPPLYPLTRAHEVDSATRWGRHKHDPLGPPQAIIGNKATANQSPLLRLVYEESHSKRTSTRQQLGE